MSVTKEVKPKRKYTKKVKPEVPAVSTETSKEAAAKAVAEILSQASAQSQTALVSPVSIDGAKTGASSHDTLDLNQDDYIPGTRILDIQQVPARAYDEDLGVTRRVGLHGEFHYCWVHTDKVTTFRINGYKFAIYNGGNQSGLADRGFQGTGIYEKTFDQHIRNGDMFLMWITKRHYEALEKDETEQRSRWESAAQDEIHNDGYKRGIRTFREEDGVTIYN